MMKLLLLTSSFIFSSSCSLFGIQSEQGPKYEVIYNEKNFEIRRYQSYLIAQTKVEGSYKQGSTKAFRILASYIFGKNEQKSKIAMTSPVKIQNSSTTIAMTSPVKIKTNDKSLTMSFAMPSEFTLENIPRPLDKRITVQQVPAKTIAVIRYSWLSSEEKNKKMAKKLQKWLEKFKQYNPSHGYHFAGYNPPWTIPFFRRNEIHIELK